MEASRLKMSTVGLFCNLYEVIEVQVRVLTLDKKKKKFVT